MKICRRTKYFFFFNMTIKFCFLYVKKYFLSCGDFFNLKIKNSTHKFTISVCDDVTDIKVRSIKILVAIFKLFANAIIFFIEFGHSLRLSGINITNFHFENQTNYWWLFLYSVYRVDFGKWTLINWATHWYVSIILHNYFISKATRKPAITNRRYLKWSRNLFRWQAFSQFATTINFN